MFCSFMLYPTITLFAVLVMEGEYYAPQIGPQQNRATVKGAVE